MSLEISHSSGIVEKALYKNIDTRMTCDPNSFDIDPGLRRNMLATVCLMTSREIKKRNINTWEFTDKVKTLAEQLSRRSKLIGGVYDDSYHDELAPGHGSGFFIGGKNRNKIMTAGHCVVKSIVNDLGRVIYLNELPDDSVTKKVRVVFSFFGAPKENQDYPIPDNHVYRIRKIKYYNYNSYGLDYAVCTLDRPVEDNEIQPVEYDFYNRVSPGLRVYVIGHPNGLSQKMTETVSVLDGRTELEKNFKFQAPLETFSGNSGSPVFDEDHIVRGILVSGHRDYKKVGDKIIKYVVTQEKIKKKGYEKCVRLQRFMFDPKGDAYETEIMEREETSLKNVGDLISTLWGKYYLKEKKMEKEYVSETVAEWTVRISSLFGMLIGGCPLRKKMLNIADKIVEEKIQIIERKCNYKGHVKQLKYIEEHSKTDIGKNEYAYGISTELSEKIIEVMGLLNNQFGPKSIKNFIQYEEKNGQMSSEQRKTFLRMQFKKTLKIGGPNEYNA